MDRSQLPSSAFIHPTGENRQDVEKLAHQILERLLSHLTNATERSPLPDPIEITPLATIPETPLNESLLLDQLDRILTASMNVANPAGYIGHMDSVPSQVSRRQIQLRSILRSGYISLKPV